VPTGQRNRVFEIEIDARGVREARGAVREIRRQLEREARQIAVGSAREIVLPRAQAAAPVKTGRLRRSLRVYRRRRNTLAIRTSVPYAGLVEFGGTRRDVIRPRRRKALAFGGGHPIARVKTPRRYRRRERIWRAVAGMRERFADELERRLVAWWERKQRELLGR